jgi:hypothetical protein
MSIYRVISDENRGDNRHCQSFLRTTAKNVPIERSHIMRDLGINPHTEAPSTDFFSAIGEGLQIGHLITVHDF